MRVRSVKNRNLLRFVFVYINSVLLFATKDLEQINKLEFGIEVEYIISYHIRLPPRLPPDIISDYRQALTPKYTYNTQTPWYFQNKNFLY